MDNEFISKVAAQMGPDASPASVQAMAACLAALRSSNITDVRESWEPVYSTLFLPLDVVQPYPAATPNAQTMAHVAPRIGVYDVFAYGEGDPLTLQYGAQGYATPATRAETNLIEKNSVGPAFKAVDSISMSSIAPWIRWNLADADTANGEPNPTEPRVLAAYNGLAPFYDDNSYATPQETSPLKMLEDQFAQALAPYLRFVVKFDQNSELDLGVGALIPDSANKSDRRANGVADVGNRLKLPSGFYWPADGQPGSRIQVRCFLDRAPVLPISLLLLWGKTVARVGGGKPIPQGINMPFRISLHGPKYQGKTNNA